MTTISRQSEIVVNRILAPLVKGSAPLTERLTEVHSIKTESLSLAIVNGNVAGRDPRFLFTAYPCRPAGASN